MPPEKMLFVLRKIDVARGKGKQRNGDVEESHVFFKRFLY